MEDKIIVNEKEISKKEFIEMMDDPNIRLKKIEENKYIILEKMYG